MRYSGLKQRQGQVVKNKQSIFSLEDQQQLWASQKRSLNLSTSSHHKAISFDVHALLQMFAKHFTVVQQCFRIVEAELTRVEEKLANCFGKFNTIEWRLSKEMHEIGQAKLLNSSLLKMNQQVQQKLAAMRKDYEDLKKRRYVSGLEKSLDDLRESVSKAEWRRQKQNLTQQHLLALEDNLDRLQQLLKRSNPKESKKEEVLTAIISDLVAIVRSEKQVGQWIQEKIKENITLKFDKIKAISISY